MGIDDIDKTTDAAVRLHLFANGFWKPELDERTLDKLHDYIARLELLVDLTSAIIHRAELRKQR